MTYVSHIIDQFGGIRPMAAAIGKPVSTVQSWKVRGSIPDHIKPAILTRARVAGIELSPADFFPVNPSDAA
jgi:hypothetical protein